MAPPAAGLVVYAVDPRRLSRFYATVTGLVVTETAPGHVVLESPTFQLVLVQMPAEAAATIDLSAPPARREETPLKPVFTVASLETARLAAAELGGTLDPAGTEWQFRHWRVCDGHDPEGNVFQLRERTASSRERSATPAGVRPFTDDEFPPFREAQVRAFSAALGAAESRPAAEFVRTAHELFDRLMPDGLATAGMRVLHVLDDDGRDAGVLWVGPHRQRADALYVNDVEIDTEHRGRGLGRAAMLTAEQIARDGGYAAIGLNVFGYNEVARSLYDSLGYQVASTQMTKGLGPPG